MGDEAKELHPQGGWNSTHKHWKGILGNERRLDKDAELTEKGVCGKFRNNSYHFGKLFASS